MFHASWSSLVGDEQQDRPNVNIYLRNVAQQSNNYGIIPCMCCCIIFWVCYKHNSLPLGLVQYFRSIY